MQMFALNGFYFPKMARISQNYPKKWREFLLIQQLGGAGGEEREFLFLSEISLQPDAVLEEKNKNKN